MQRLPYYERCAVESDDQLASRDDERRRIIHIILTACEHGMLTNEAKFALIERIANRDYDERDGQAA